MSEDNFLARWSQRKRQVAAEARKTPEPAPEQAPETPEEEPFDLSLLPKLEDLTPETDISLFMRKGVPQALRNAALRKIWALDPAIRDYRGEALDYAWDWNAPGGVPGGGDLPAGFDPSEMVAKIFGDAPDKNVIGNVAAQQIGLSQADSAPNSGAFEPISGGEKPAESCSKAQVETEIAQNERIAAAPKKRRHGGATPTLSDKSIVS